MFNAKSFAEKCLNLELLEVMFWKILLQMLDLLTKKASPIGLSVSKDMLFHRQIEHLPLDRLGMLARNSTISACS